MEEQKEEKYFHFENVGKNIITTLIGSVLMCLSTAAVVIEWFFDLKNEIPGWQIGIVFLVGFILLFMRDSAKSYVDMFVRKKLTK